MSGAESGSAEPGCREGRRAIESALSLDGLAPGVLRHAEGCAACGEALTRLQALAVVTAQARRALEQVRAEPDEVAWRRIERAIEAGAGEGRAGRSWWSWGWAVPAVVIAGAVVVIAGVGSDPGVGAGAGAGAGAGSDPGVGAGAGAGAGPGAGVGAGAGVATGAGAGVGAGPALSEGGVEIPVAPGHRIEADTERSLVAFGRHRFELEAGTSLVLDRFAADGVALTLERGVASFEVERAPGEAAFRVSAGDVAVEVRGTVFSVARRESGVTVSVERGRVAVTRDGSDEVEVGAGERVVFPTLAAALLEEPPEEPVEETSAAHAPGQRPEERPAGERAEAPRRRPAPKKPKPERMVEVEVGHIAMSKPTLEGPEVSNLIPAILSAVRAGRCVQALSALEQVAQAAEGRLPRAGLWLTAYCQRRLGNLERSRTLFQRYGTGGPWTVPTGDELPPLP